MTIVSSLKLLRKNRTLAFYIHQYGSQEKHLLSCFPMSYLLIYWTDWLALFCITVIRKKVLSLELLVLFKNTRGAL